MLSKEKKITSRIFKEKYPKSKKKYTRHFRISFCQESEDENTRIAVVAPKKAFKKAVLRNKNKRIIYNILRQYYPQFSQGKIVFIHILKDISLLEKKEIEKEILPILSLR